MIYTVNLSDDFSQKLVDFIRQSATTPFDLAKMMILLPNKRACQTLKTAFIRNQDGKSSLLPQLVPLYELDGLEQDIPPVIEPYHRLFLLTKLCAQKPNVSGLDQALKMALSLSDVLDEFYQFEIDTQKLRELVPDKIFAEHWNETLTFLDIITDTWPKILAENHLIDKMDQNIRLIHHYTEKWRQSPPDTPVIMAGFNGNIPAIRQLAAVINRLPKGTVLLHGLEQQVDFQTWQSANDDYFQHGLKKLLNALDIKPEQVQNLSTDLTLSEQFVTESLRPPENTDSWRSLSAFDENTLTHLTRIDCENSEQEALSIALLMRQTLETPEKTAALITTDRTLARRVIIEMNRWGISLNDTAGKPLLKTRVGIFLMLLANWGQNPTDANLTALLKHPLSADQQIPTQLRQKIKSSEIRARKNATPLNIDLSIQKKLTVFQSLFQNNILIDFETVLKQHIELAELLATTNDESGKERLWNHEDGQTAFAFLTQLLNYASLVGDIEPAQYTTILELLMQQIQVRPKYGTHPRLSILGPIESRFTHPDVCILGGLNDGVWPLIPDSGPWLNRPMRQKLGLPSLESKIAESAWDFAHNFCAKEVYITRSLKTDGTPTIPSRFLSRMEAVAEAVHLPFIAQPALLAQKINQPTKFTTLQRPAPTPPVCDRPRHLSVTEIKTWMRDPYSIYAKHILKLKPLMDLDENQKPQFYGTALHAALNQFISDKKNINNASYLLDLFKTHLKQYHFTETELAFYEPKLKQIAIWFIQQQNERTKVVQTFTEQAGRVLLQTAGEPFELVCQADRIDLLNDNTVDIIDYKTGYVPKPKEVKFSYEPQLPLEAYILSQNGFDSISAHPIHALNYWKLSGKIKGSSVESVISSRDTTTTVSNLIHETIYRLTLLINTFDCEKTPYESCPIPAHMPQYNDYAYLARIAEWKHADEEGDSE